MARRQTFEPKTFCECCGMNKKEARGEPCLYNKRHTWNKKRVTLTVQCVEEMSRARPAGER